MKRCSLCLSPVYGNRCGECGTPVVEGMPDESAASVGPAIDVGPAEAEARVHTTDAIVVRRVAVPRDDLYRLLRFVREVPMGSGDVLDSFRVLKAAGGFDDADRDWRRSEP